MGLAPIPPPTSADAWIRCQRGSYLGVNSSSLLIYLEKPYLVPPFVLLDILVVAVRLRFLLKSKATEGVRMQVVTGAMGTLLPKLADLLAEEYKLHKNLRGEIMFLKAELESMEAALLKISEAPIDHPPDPQVKLWARDVRDLSYDIEDSVDKFMVCIDTQVPDRLHSRFKGFIDRGMNLLTRAKLRHKIGISIKEIKSRIKEVSERRDRYKVDSVATKRIGPSVDSLRLSALYKRATELTGTRDTSDELVKRLIEGDEESKKQPKIVSIVGVGGLGKTTLANVVYERLKMQFDCVAFVSVSLNPNIEKTFKNMLHQFDREKYCNINESSWGEPQLINELKEFLQNKRYLTVIDDIWDKYAWEKIKYSLIENEHGSRIITTTRLFDVAKQAGGVYQLKPLSQVDSRKLFYLRIFGVEDKCPNQLAKLSENILKKCGGVPLAIVTIASMLASKIEKENSHKYWSKVYQYMGSGLEDSPDVKDMRRILSISYYDLPPHLKTCLLYLSLYPEDSVIRRNDLIWKWIGEGFVCKQWGKSLYEAGEDYFDDLINKSLIQPVYIDNEDNKAMSCRIHDMVLDLISSLSNEDYFATTLSGQLSIAADNMVRRLSLQSANEDDVKQLSTLSLSHVRSLIFFEGSDFFPAFSSFHVLRVLDLSRCKVDNDHCKDICTYLFHLRFLDLSWTSITEIPKEISNLQFLRVLYIRRTKIEELPPTFVQLGQLVCLKINSTIRIPDGFGNLKSLEELRANIIITSLTNVHDLGKLTELRRLHIEFEEWDDTYEEAFCQCLSNLISLEELMIIGCDGSLESACDNLLAGHQQLHSIHMSFSHIYAVPNWMACLSSLSELEIVLNKLGDEDLHVLGSIPSLSHLTLTVKNTNMNSDERLIGNGYPFQSLIYFYFRSDTMMLVFAQEAMQKLQILLLVFDAQKTMDWFGHVDLGLENLPVLQDADILLFNCTEEMFEVIEAAIERQISMNPNNPTLELGYSLCPETWASLSIVF